MSLLEACVVCVYVFILAITFECVSQFTYHRKSISEIKAGFPRTVLKVSVIVGVMLVSTLVWWRMGWQDGQEIHLHWPWHSN